MISRSIGEQLVRNSEACGREKGEEEEQEEQEDSPGITTFFTSFLTMRTSYPNLCPLFPWRGYIFPISVTTIIMIIRSIGARGVSSDSLLTVVIRGGDSVVREE